MSNWKFTSYTQRGINHSVCQDRVKIYEDRHRLIACLCDGLGSLNNSHIAAEVTVNTVIETFCGLSATRCADKQIKPLLMNRIKSRLLETSEEKGISPVSMDCTLLFVCLFKQQDIAVIGNLGDSALCMISKSNAMLYCENFIHSDGTRAVQDEDAEQHLNVSTIKLKDSVLGFLLTSDGLENEIYFKGLDYVSKGAELYFNAVLSENPKSVIADRVKALTADPETIFYDDISVAVLSRADAPVTLPEEPTWPCVCGQNNPLYESFCIKCGRDFLDMYRNVDFKGDKTFFFRKVQRNPEKRRKLIESLCDAATAPASVSAPAGNAAVTNNRFSPPQPQSAYGYSAPNAQVTAESSYPLPGHANNAQPVHRNVPRQAAARNSGGGGIPMLAWGLLLLGLAVGFLVGAVVMGLIKDVQNAPPRNKQTSSQPVQGGDNGENQGGTLAGGDQLTPSAAENITANPDVEQTTQGVNMQPTTEAVDPLVGTWKALSIKENGQVMALESRYVEMRSITFGEGGTVDTNIGNGSFWGSGFEYHLDIDNTRYHLSLNEGKTTFELTQTGTDNEPYTIVYKKEAESRQPNGNGEQPSDNQESGDSQDD